MNISKLKDLLIRSLDEDADPLEVSGKIEEAGVSYNFRENFHDKVMDKIYMQDLLWFVTLSSLKA